MEVDDFKHGKRIVVTEDHVRGGRILARKGQTGYLFSYDTTFMHLGIMWFSVKLDGYKRCRSIPPKQLEEIE